MHKREYAHHHEAIMWNPWNLIVQDHRNGRMYKGLTNEARRKRKLPPLPWFPDKIPSGAGIP